MNKSIDLSKGDVVSLYAPNGDVIMILATDMGNTSVRVSNFANKQHGKQISVNSETRRFESTDCGFASDEVETVIEAENGHTTTVSVNAYSKFEVDEVRYAYIDRNGVSIYVANEQEAHNCAYYAKSNVWKYLNDVLVDEWTPTQLDCSNLIDGGFHNPATRR